MKNKTIGLAILTVLLSSLILLTPVNAMCVNLPTDPVTLTFEFGGTTKETRFPAIVTLSGVPSGYDVTNGPYPGWCVELGVPIAFSPTTHSATLSCTNGLGSPWNNINYLLNKYAGYSPGLDVQMAIWRLLGYSEAYIISQGWTFTTAAANMYEDALANGGGFVASSGDIVGVRCTIDQQDLLIQLEIPQEEYSCETAFGLYASGTYKGFVTDLGYNRWGWTNQLPGYGEYEFEIWAGAAKEDTTKGTLVGYVTITYDASGLSWDVEMLDGYILGEVHVYAGTGQLPLFKGSPTLAPGKYYIDLSGANTPIWVIWHAGVCIPI